MATVQGEQNSTLKSIRYWVILGFALAIQSGHALQFEFGSSLSAYEIGLLFFVVVGIVATLPRYEVPTVTIKYLLLLFGFLIVLIATASLGSAIIRILAHVLAISGAIIIAVALTERMTAAFLYALWLASLPVLSADIAAFVGIISPGNTAGIVIPLTQYGGIGIPTGFGTHGLILNSGIIAGVGVLWVCDITRFKSHILQTTIIGMGIMQVFSQSRSSLLALAMGVGLIGISKLLNSDRSVYIHLCAIIVGISITVMGGIFLATQRLKTLVGRFDQLEVAFGLIVENPFTGIGWDIFYPTYYDEVIHFTPANYFVSGGIILGIIYLMLIFYPIMAYIRANSTSWSKISTIYAALFIAVCVEILFVKATPSVHLFSYGVALTVVAHESVHQKV